MTAKTRRYTRTVAERFWEKVEIGEGCWLWTANRRGLGYGGLQIAGRAVLAHRVSWELHYGAIPDGLWVLHHCDNPPCVNPAHLFLGTRADNIADMVAKGRAWNPTANAFKARTRCNHGHELTPENTSMAKGWRSCKACVRVRNNARYQNLTEAEYRQMLDSHREWKRRHRARLRERRAA